MEFLYIKAFHIIMLVSWMAMLFYLPRLFVYHAQHRDNESFINIVKLQELRLYKYIGMPAFVLTLLTGITMIVLNPVFLKVSESWSPLQGMCWH